MQKMCNDERKCAAVMNGCFYSNVLRKIKLMCMKSLKRAKCPVMNLFLLKHVLHQRFIAVR